MINHARDGEAAERAPLTNGRVDLVFRDGDELVVVDYKTDKDVTKETAEQYARKHHAGQGEVYAHGLSDRHRPQGPRGRVRLLQGRRRGAAAGWRGGVKRRPDRA